MVSYAWRSVPFYRDTFHRLGLLPSDISTARDLARLPVIDRADIQRDPERFCSTIPRPADLLELRSGGSTGAPRRVFHDLRGVFQNAAHGERERAIWTGVIGRRIGYRELIIAPPRSSTFKVQQFGRDRGWYPSGVGIERRYLSLLDSPARVVEEINAFRPDVIHSYGSFLNLLFLHLLGEGAGSLACRPSLVTYSSDALADSMRTVIAGTFGIPVFSTYQAVEAFKIGFECEHHGGLHLNIDLYPVRIGDADGRELPAGETGEVFVSNLVNGGTVLLNYRLGDTAALLPGPCPCGRTLPRLSFPQGRSDDVLTLPSGRVLHPQAVRNQFNDETEVVEYQVRYDGASGVRVSMVAAPSCDRAAASARVAQKLTALLGEGATVEVRFVDTIDRTAGGKHRAVMVSGAGSSAAAS
jgi:phenylacetate-CoA ligase